MTTPTPPVSGPGALSRRTDTGPTQKLATLPDAEYGENATYQDLQRDAGLAQSQGGVQPQSAANQYASQVVPISAPTQNPNTPVTDGAMAGPGADMSALGLTPQSQQDLKQWVQYLPVLEYMANQDGASWTMRNTVRQLKAMV